MTVSLRDAFSPVGLNVSPDLDYDDWAALGDAIGGMARATPWMVGDWWAFGEARFGEISAQDAATIVNLNRQTLLNYGSVARRIPPQDRQPTLSWYAHSLVAALPRAERNRILKRAVADGWDSGRIKATLASQAVASTRDNGERPPITPEEALTLIKSDPVWNEIATRALDHPPDVVRCPQCGHQWEQQRGG